MSKRLLLANLAQKSGFDLIVLGKVGVNDRACSTASAFLNLVELLVGVAVVR